MADPNPFSGPFAGAVGIGGNPLDNEAHAGPRCPRCSSKNFHAWTNQYGIMRRCNDCREEWSGGTMAAAQPSFMFPIPADGAPAPDDDLPLNQYTGASFRDPSKIIDGDDY